MRLEILEQGSEAGKIMPILHTRNLKFREGKILAPVIHQDRVSV